MKQIFLVGFLILITSCTTVEFVRKETNPQKQAILRHSPPSNTEQESKYRDKVFQEARGFCGGDFNVTKEYQALDESSQRAGLGTGFGVGANSSIFMSSAGPSRSMYSFVEISCR